MVGMGDRIKELRTNQKMTQAEFAARLGVTKSAVSSYENSSRLPSYDILIKMARIFKVSTDVLLGQAEGVRTLLDVTGLTRPQIAAVREVVEQYQALNAALDNLPDSGKAKV